MANRYWIGGTGTWTATAKWSAASGGVGGASVPTAVDDVYFDVASSGASYTVTTTAGMTCRNLSVAGPATGTLTFSNTVNTVAVFGSFNHVATGVSWGASVGFTFSSTAPGNTITTNGYSFPNSHTFDGVGGEWILQGNVIAPATRLLSSQWHD